MSNLVSLFQAGGFMMWPLLLLSLACGGVIIERVLAFRELGHLAPGLAQRVAALAREGHWEEARRLCQSTLGPVAACLNVVLERREQTAASIERHVEETGQNYFAQLERGLPLLDTTTTIAPLLGLLGTILGMIGAFNAIAGQARRGNSDAVLGGVGEALYATAAGIVVAVICFVAYNAFAARLRRVETETEMAVTQLMNVLLDEREKVALES